MLISYYFLKAVAVKRSVAYSAALGVWDLDESDKIVSVKTVSVSRLCPRVRKTVLSETASELWDHHNICRLKELTLMDGQVCVYLLYRYTHRLTSRWWQMKAVIKCNLCHEIPE